MYVVNGVLVIYALCLVKLWIAILHYFVVVVVVVNHVCLP